MATRSAVSVALLVVFSLAAMVGSVTATPLVSDDNLLLGLTPVVSSVFAGNASSGTFGYPANLTNGAGGGPTGDFIFQVGDSQQRMVVTGFDSAVSLIRIWSGSDLFPGQVAIKSSTTAGLGLDGTFETELPGLAYNDSISAWTASGLGVDGMQMYYIDAAVNAPAGTQSLYLNFGGGRSSGPNAGWGASRVSEVQAFAPVPEPGTLALLATGLLGLLAYAWRKR